MEPRAAATVLVLREGEAGPRTPGVEVLVLRRSRASRFAPGFVVFPGGSVTGRDAELAGAWFGASGEVARACALRELAEEAGLVMTAKGLVASPGRLPGEPGLPPPRPEQVVEIARWVAPEFLPVRFDATFFAVEAPPGMSGTPDGVEIDEAWWARPQDVLRECRAGRAPLMWPTHKTLEALGTCASVDRALALRVPQVPPPPGYRPPPEAWAAERRT